jgi:hypothetical protein
MRLEKAWIRLRIRFRIEHERIKADLKHCQRQGCGSASFSLKCIFGSLLLLLIKVIGNCDLWYIDPPGLHF